MIIEQIITKLPYFWHFQNVVCLLDIKNFVEILFSFECGPKFFFKFLQDRKKRTYNQGVGGLSSLESLIYLKTLLGLDSGDIFEQLEPRERFGVATRLLPDR